MRGWAGDLNATISSAVAKVDADPAASRNDVTLTFIDPVSGGSDGIARNDPNLFEPSSGPRHELCSPSGRAWLNGIELDHPRTKSFHPNQYGEDAMGALAAEVIPHLKWPWSPGPNAATSVPVAVCPTVNGGGGTQQSQPASIPARVPLAGLPPMSLDTDDEGTAQILAPASWSCEAWIGGDGTTTVDAWPPGATAPTQNTTITGGITGYVIPGANDQGQYDLVCANWPSAAAQFGQLYGPCPVAIPSTETDTVMRSDAVAFEDPPGVKGNWDNSSGSNDANGINIFDWGGPGTQMTSDQVVCLLPASEKDICTATLNDFASHYAPTNSSTPTPVTTEQTGMPQPGGNSGATPGGTGNTGAANSGSTGNTN